MSEKCTGVAVEVAVPCTQPTCTEEVAELVVVITKFALLVVVAENVH